VGGTPGLFALGVVYIGRDEAVHALKGVSDFDFVFKAAVELLAEGRFNVFANDENYFAESGSDGVVNGVFDDALFTGADAVDLG